MSYFYNPVYWITVTDESNSPAYEAWKAQSPTLSPEKYVTVYLMQTGFSQ